MWITSRVLAASLGFRNKKAGCALLPSGLALRPPHGEATSWPGLHALLVLAVWWVEGYLNNATVVADSVLAAPSQWLLTLEGSSPQWASVFLSIKWGES